MEIEEIVKRLEWLDDERRRDRNTIASMEDRLMTLDGNVTGLLQKINDVSSEITRIGVMITRFDGIEASLAQLRVEFGRSMENIEKQRAEHDREVDKVRRVDLEGLNKAIGEVRKGLDPIPELRKGIQMRVDEDFRLGRLVEELKNTFEEDQRSDEDFRRNQRIMEEGRRQDTKRLTDIQAEVSSLRKRIDEQRGKVDLASESVRKLEIRMTELASNDSERRQTQSSFIEKQTLQQVDREREWKEWQTQFDEISQKAVSLDAELQELDATNRALKRSQQAFEEITQKFDRRVNEITEMQRLAEERFRQEWMTFRGDDQKRWMNYSLTQEEQQREAARQQEKLNERLLVLEDLTQELRDFSHQLTEDIHKRLHDMLNLAHQWVENYDQIVGGPK
jgi:chromosome segregation ATPase